MEKRCDIIIPIYNAYDFVEKCIKSVLENTNFNNSHLILIDDKSPDERIVPLLESIEKKNKNRVTLLKNQKNLGFVSTVNRGLKFSKNDVLILNSDTEVTDGWLDGMKECAYREKMIATVTPLSNNKTPVCLPFYNKDNAIPKGYSLNDLALLIKDCSLKLYPEIPSSHGFCMYIKREALDKVGFFDEKTFGKGYGEENDFCFRCFQYGYKHVLCDDVYVFHKGAQSFLDKGEMHNKELESKYPKIWIRVDEWFKRQDLAKIGNNVALAIEAKKKRSNVLVLTDNEKKNEELINFLRKSVNVHFLSSDESFYTIKSYFENVDLMTAIFEKPMRVEQGKKLYSSSYARMINSIIDDYGITLVFVYDMGGHYYDVFDICRDKKIQCSNNPVEGLEEICEKSKKKSVRYDAVRDRMLEYEFYKNCSYVEKAENKKNMNSAARRVFNRLKRMF